VLFAGLTAKPGEDAGVAMNISPSGRPGMRVAALHGVRPPVRQVIRKVAVVHHLLEPVSDFLSSRGQATRKQQAAESVRKAERPPRTFGPAHLLEPRLRACRLPDGRRNLSCSSSGAASSPAPCDLYDTGRLRARQAGASRGGSDSTRACVNAVVTKIVGRHGMFSAAFNQPGHVMQKEVTYR
jgi:hypothetical protein